MCKPLAGLMFSAIWLSGALSYIWKLHCGPCKRIREQIPASVVLKRAVTLLRLALCFHGLTVLERGQGDWELIIRQVCGFRSV